MKTFGEKLKQLRKNTGKGQVQVAAEMRELIPEIRISQTTLSALEQRISVPRQDIIDKLAAYFNVPTVYFYQDNEPVEERVDFALAYIRSLHNRTYAPGNFVRQEMHPRFPSEDHNMRIWQPELAPDEYLED